MIRHSIITPVYNRKVELIELFGHIKDMDYPYDQFEWIIIDDGSVNPLKETVEDFSEQVPDLNIRYFYKQNGGIHTAQNFGIREARGQYITRIDSDDYLLPDALTKKDFFLHEIENCESIAGVVGLCLNKSDLSIRGLKFPQNKQITTGVKLRTVTTGDKNWCMRTDVMRQFLIPEYKETKWVPEGVALWMPLDKKYKTLFVNEAFAVCSEPNPTSMTGAIPNNYMIMSAYYRAIIILNKHKSYLPIIDVLKSYIKIPYYIIKVQPFEGVCLSKPYHDLQNYFDKIIISLCYPIGYCIYFIRKIKK